jgi:hypothetical protein
LLKFRVQGSSPRGRRRVTLLARLTPYTPFLFQKSARYSRNAAGGAGHPSWQKRVSAQETTRYLLRCQLSAELDLVVFTTLVLDVASPFSVLTGDGLAAEDDNRVQFLVLPAQEVETSWQPHPHERVFALGPETRESVEAESNTEAAFAGHKLGGIPNLNQRSVDIMRDMELLASGGWRFFLQLSGFLKGDDPPPELLYPGTGTWLLLATNLLVWVREGADGFEFRYTFN